MENIICKGVSFTYPQTENKALDGVSFTVNKGEFCLVSGASAAGKSTLLKLLKKEIAPAGELNGSVEVRGSVGYVSQNVEENIVCDKVRSELSFGLTNLGLSEDKIELLTAEVASYFNLEDKLDNDIKTLSGGEKQMVNLAAVMIMKPEVLVLDEPCSQLDPVSADRFVEMVKRLHKDFGATVVISEHNSEELFCYADSIIVLDNSHFLIKDTPQRVFEYLKTNLHPMLAAVPPTVRYGADVKERIEAENTSAKECAADVKGIYFTYEKVITSFFMI